MTDDLIPPLIFTWDGEAMRPASKYWGREADKHYTVGERYPLVVQAERSSASHNHEFAWLTEAWNSLPDDLLVQYPNREVLRKHGLIAKGHCTVVQHVCPTKAEAERLAAILKPRDVYAIVIQRGNVVSEYTAVSQSRRAMGNAQFQASKSDLMDFVGELLGVDPETLGKVEQAA
jgi:hypothetical protein